jgi:hypothetical protein
MLCVLHCFFIASLTGLRAGEDTKLRMNTFLTLGLDVIRGKMALAEVCKCGWMMC